MAIPKRGSSQIVVDSITYRWRVRDRPTYSQGNGWGGIIIAVAAEQNPSTTLIVNLEREHVSNWLEIPSQPVIPNEVEQWIRKARANGWTPLEAGKPFEMHESTRGKDETPVTEMNIRPATPADARAVAELLVSLTEYPNFQKQGLEMMTTRVTQNLKSQHDQQLVLVAELEERVVAYAVTYWMTLLFASPEGYISELFVHADASGHGVGTALLETIRTAAVARGCGRLTLINMTDRESYRRQFYAARGWTEQENAVRFVLNLEMNS